MFGSLVTQIQKKTLPVLLEQVTAADKQQTTKTRKLLEDDVAYCDVKSKELQDYLTSLYNYKDYVVKMNNLNYDESIIQDLTTMNTQRQTLLDQEAAEAFASHYKMYISTIDDLIKNKDYVQAVATTLHILKLIKILKNPDESEVIESKKNAVVFMLMDLFIKDCFHKQIHEQLCKLCSQEELKAVYKKIIASFFTTITQESFSNYLRFKDAYKIDMPLDLNLGHSSIEQYNYLLSIVTPLKGTGLDYLVDSFINSFTKTEQTYFVPNFNEDTFQGIYTRGLLLDMDIDSIRDTIVKCQSILVTTYQNCLVDLEKKYKQRNMNFNETELLNDAKHLWSMTVFVENPVTVGELTIPFPNVSTMKVASTFLSHCFLLYPLINSSSISASCERMLLIPDLIDQIGFKGTDMISENAEFQNCFTSVQMSGDHVLQTTRTVVMLFQCLLWQKYYFDTKDEYFHDLEYSAMMIGNIGIPVLDIINSIRGDYPQYTGEVPVVHLDEIIQKIENTKVTDNENAVQIAFKDNIWMKILNYFDFNLELVLNKYKS